MIALSPFSLEFVAKDHCKVTLSLVRASATILPGLSPYPALPYLAYTSC